MFETKFRIIWILSLLSLQSIAYQNEKNPINVLKTDDSSKYIRVAFVFAGSVRSFVTEHVYMSIKKNLVDSFCPHSSCIPDVFFRISMTDNLHVGADAAGTQKAADKSIVPNVKKALDSLSPIKSGDKLAYIDVDFVDIGSSMERKQKLEEFKGFRHKVFRELESRRYSMYFNRYRSYKMAMDREIKMGFNYTWVVHARMDAAWGEPIRPYHCWPDQVWVHDTWHSTVPDTFALLPRRFSDGYYSMDLLVSPGVMCLGGPNFAESTLTDSSLKTLGFSPAEMTTIRAQRCEVAHPNEMVVQQKGPVRFDKWSLAGQSEFILMRKMDQLGVSRGRDTLGFAQMFMAVVRYPLSPMCFYLTRGYKYPFLEDSPFDFHPETQAFFTGCVFFLGPAVPDITTISDQHRASFSAHVAQLSSLTAAPPPNPLVCMGDVHRDQSLWNFMPFRLRHEGTNNCMTLTLSKNTGSMRVASSECLDHEWIGKREYVMYSQNQLIQFHWIRNYLQSVKHVDEEGVVRCLTMSVSKMTGAFKTCLATKSPLQQFRMLTVSSRDISKASVKFTWTSRQHFLCMCMGMGMGGGMGGGSPNIKQTLFFKPCNQTSQDTKCIFHAERTYSTGPNYTHSTRNLPHTHHLMPSWQDVLAERSRVSVKVRT